MLKKLEEMIANHQKESTSVEQLTVRIPKEQRKKLRKLATKARIKEGPMLKVMIEWAILMCWETLESQKVSKAIVSEAVESPAIGESYEFLKKELSELKTEISGFRSELGDRCESCLIRGDIAALKESVEVVVQREGSGRSWRDGNFSNPIGGIEQLQGTKSK